MASEKYRTSCVKMVLIAILTLKGGYIGAQFSITYDWDSGNAQGWDLTQIAWSAFDCSPPYVDYGLFNNINNWSYSYARSPDLPVSNGGDITIDLLTRWGTGPLSYVYASIILGN